MESLATELVNINCRICGLRQNARILPIREMHFGTRLSYDYFECKDCGCIQILHLPESMNEFYPDDYYSLSAADHDPGKRVIDDLKDRVLRLRDRAVLLEKGNIGLIANRVKRNKELKFNSILGLGIEKDTCILDVGCGSGEFIKYLTQLGLRNLWGIDPFMKEVEHSVKGMTLLKTELKDLVMKNLKFDVIMMHHVLEHLEDQYANLNWCNALLKDNGTIIIRIPVADCHAWREFGNNWVQLDAPRHHYIHTHRSLTKLAETAGFNVVSVKHDSNEFQFWGSIQYLNDIPLMSERSYLIAPSESIFSDKDIADFRKRANELNDKGEGDQCVFILKKTAR